MTIDLTTPLNLALPATTQFLAGIQGNILGGHGRDHAMHLFVSFGTLGDGPSYHAHIKGARAWIGNLVQHHITSAASHQTLGAKVFTTLLLSAAGYDFLGERRPTDGAFRDGMRDRRFRLSDPPVKEWEAAYQVDEQNLHALLIVATVTAAELGPIKLRILQELAAFGGTILVDERGHQEKGPGGINVEHFGYADGVSQPRFVRKPGDVVAHHFNQQCAPDLVLTEDRQAPGHYGSYMVFRKLEQNVRSFDDAVRKVADSLGQPVDLVGAMAVGRFKNGTPITIHPTPVASHDDDFNYAHDADATKCPLHAHIRKTNPRGSLKPAVGLLAREKTRRIARRGITYTTPATPKSPTRQGLLFMCYQSDIKQQFEFIQRTWANNPNFSKPLTGLDPVIGQDGGPQEALIDSPRWPTHWDSTNHKRINFGEHVKLRGGEYFFAPSIQGLKNLAT